MVHVFTNDIPNREIMGKAISFYEASEVLWSNGNLSSPYIVCASFAVELFIKSLNAQTFCEDSDYFKDEDGLQHYSNLHSKSDCREHGLLKLFQNLPESLKNDLRNFYISVDHPYDYKSIDLLLEHVNNSFVDFRYSYEKNIGSLNMTALYNLCCIFHKFVFGLYEKIANK